MSAVPINFLQNASGSVEDTEHEETADLSTEHEETAEEESATGASEEEGAVEDGEEGQYDSR